MGTGLYSGEMSQSKTLFMHRHNAGLHVCGGVIHDIPCDVLCNEIADLFVSVRIFARFECFLDILHHNKSKSACQKSREVRMKRWSESALCLAVFVIIRAAISSRI